MQQSLPRNLGCLQFHIVELERHIDGHNIETWPALQGPRPFDHSILPVVLEYEGSHLPAVTPNLFVPLVLSIRSKADRELCKIALGHEFDEPLEV